VLLFGIPVYIYFHALCGVRKLKCTETAVYIYSTDIKQYISTPVVAVVLDDS